MLIDPNKLFYLARNADFSKEYISDFIRYIKYGHEKLIVNTDVLDKIKEKLTKNDEYLTEKEQNIINSLKTKIDQLKSKIINNILKLEVQFRNRLYFIPIFNFKRELVISLLNNGLIANAKSWEYFDVSAAEMRIVSFLSLSMNNNLSKKYHDLLSILLISNYPYHVIKYFFSLHYKTNFIKNSIIISIHGGNVRTSDDKFNEFLLLIKQIFSDDTFVMTSQIMILHSLYSVLHDNKVLFFFNYDGGYIIELE